MHILYLHQHFSTPRGSVGTRSYEMARALIADGHSVTVVCGSYSTANTGLENEFCRGKRTGVLDGIQIIELAIPCSNSSTFFSRIWSFASFSIRSCWLALTAKYDLIFATSTPLTVAVPGLVGKWIRRKRFIFEVRDLWPELPKQMGVIKNPLLLFLMRLLEKSAYRSADHCIGLAPGIVQAIAKDINPSKVSLIPNGCDLDLFNQDKVHASQQSLSKLQTKFTIVFTGTHGQANGVGAILDVAALLQDREEISFLLVGDGALKPDLVESSKRRKLKNVYFESPLPKNSLAELLPECSVGLQVLANFPAFYYGTSPNKFFDYIASGLPVITNYPGWIADLINEYNCGIAVRPDDTEAFAHAIITIINSPDLMKKMGECSRKLAEKQFNRSAQAQMLVDVIQTSVH